MYVWIQGLFLLTLVNSALFLFFWFSGGITNMAVLVILYILLFLAGLPAIAISIFLWATFLYRFEENGIYIKVWSFGWRDIFLPFGQIEYVEIVSPPVLKMFGMKLILLKFKDSLARLSDVDVAFVPLLIKVHLIDSILDLTGYFLQKRWRKVSLGQPKFFGLRWFPPHSIFFWFVQNAEANETLKFISDRLKDKKSEL